MKAYLQKLGRALMLPVAVLPAAAILMGIGYAIDPSGWGADSPTAAFLVKAGSSILDNIPYLFAVGVALGLSKDKDGSAALSGLVAFLVIKTLLSTDSVAMLQGINPEDVNVAFTKIENAFIGMLPVLLHPLCIISSVKHSFPLHLRFSVEKDLCRF